MSSLTPREGALLIPKLQHHLVLLERKLIRLQKLREEVHEEVSEQLRPLEVILNKSKSSTRSYGLNSEVKSDLHGITMKISDLVAKVPRLPDMPTRQKALSLYPHSQDNLGDNNGKRIVHLPGLHENAEVLTKLMAFRQVEQKFMELEDVKKMCLLTFAVFPENREVHRTMLMYWWIGEGILPVERAGETVREIVKVFTDKKLIEPVEERRKVAPSSYKMNPFVHSSVIHLSQEIGLFVIYRERQKPTMRQSMLRKVCLVEGSSYQREATAKGMESTEQIETVFNISERYPEFAFKWFSEPTSKMLRTPVFKSLHVFYLGRWERTQKRQIEVPNPELMRYLNFMKNLRVLSFQGISTIRRLNSSVCTLHKLSVLDLRECSDLTQLPEKINSLHSLVYLDMTGCYMLEWIPMRLASLHNLEVLKGFVVSDTAYEGVACTLILLKRLKKLRKLSIEIHRDDLGVHQLMEDLVKIKALTSLKVTWRKNLNIVRAGKPENFTEIKSLPDQLKKLDLQRYPHEELPNWLHPRKLLHLKKLHIGGGRLLKGFGALPEKATECAVETLRLTSLPRVRTGWIELKKLYFPNLTFLEKYDCPKISLTPCDGNGIWRSDQDDQ